mmetsp:Transcript_102312/g.294502  ORF Transcript_102312/g.294502 Transcript_102312/m.294502 type:complete len:333 (-) Transcript_102312:1099-2097(-)
MPHEVVFAPGLPAHAVQALILALEKGGHGFLGEHLYRAEHHGGHAGLVAVHDVSAPTGVLRQDGAHTAGEHHCVRVELDGPVRDLVLPRLQHLLPHVQEQLRVARGVVHGGADVHGPEGDRVHRAVGAHAEVHAHEGLRLLDVAGRRVPLGRHACVRLAAEDRVLLAREDADTLIHLVPDQVRLVAHRADDVEAKERRGHPRLRCARAQLLALPRLVVDVPEGRAVLAGGAVAETSGPTVILGEASGPDVTATSGLAAVLVRRGALVGHPRRDVAARGDLRAARRSGAELLASPRRGVLAEKVGPRSAARPAEGLLVVLLEALHAGLAATTR